MSKRRENLFSAIAVLTLASAVAWLSHTQEPPESFLFPRLISIVFVALALLNLVLSLLVASRNPSQFQPEVMKNIPPGLLVILVLIFFAAKALGFYLASSITFFTLFSLYDHHPHHLPSSWFRRAYITGLFMLIIYLLFAWLLKVQTPTGIAF